MSKTQIIIEKLVANNDTRTVYNTARVERVGVDTVETRHLAVDSRRCFNGEFSRDVFVARDSSTGEYLGCVGSTAQEALRFVDGYTRTDVSLHTSTATGKVTQYVDVVRFGGKAHWNLRNRDEVVALCEEETMCWEETDYSTGERMLLAMA